MGASGPSDNLADLLKHFRLRADSRPRWREVERSPPPFSFKASSSACILCSDRGCVSALSVAYSKLFINWAHSCDPFVTFHRM